MMLDQRQFYSAHGFNLSKPIRYALLPKKIAKIVPVYA